MVEGKREMGQVTVAVKAEEPRPGVKVVTLGGEIDLQSSPAVRTALHQHLVEGTALLLVDLGAVSYIDSSGIATLVEAFQWCHRHNASFRLSGLRPAVKDIFELAKLDDVFHIYPTREEALS